MSMQAPPITPEEAAVLGEPRAAFYPKANSVALGYIVTLALLLLAGSLLTAAVLSVVKEGASGLLDGGLLLAAAALPLWGALALGRRAERLRRLVVVVHDGGVLRVDGAGRTACPWDQIEGVWEKSFHLQEVSTVAIGGVIPVPGTTDQRYIGTSHRFTLRLANGVEFVFTDEIKDVERLGELLRQGHLRHKLPPALRAYREGETVTFGKWAVSKRGLSDGGRLLPWEEVGGLSVSLGKVWVYAGEQWQKWSPVPCADVANFVVFWALTSDILSGKADE